MQQRLADLEKQIMAEAGCAPAAAAPPDEPSIDEFVELKIAAAAFGMHPDTMLNKCVLKHGLGRKIGGRWKVDMVRARAWRAGRPFDPL